MTMRPSHRWSEPPERPSEHLSIRVCQHCGLRKLTHHEWNEHWTTYEAPWGGRVVECDRNGPVTPRCDTWFKERAAEVAANG